MSTGLRPSKSADGSLVLSAEAQRGRNRNQKRLSISGCVRKPGVIGQGSFASRGHGIAPGGAAVKATLHGAPKRRGL
jgi:hypothetical protein